MVILYVICAIVILDVVNCQIQDTIKATLANVPEDGLMTFLELAEKYGHPAVEYDVTTSDGYILKLYNLPGDQTKPILLAHGVFDSSDGWIIRGNKSLAILLANEGYDVWVMNFRGNRYSRRHTSLDPDKDTKFWDYSVHEYASYDLPACIDHALNVTGQKQLILIGFSEGTTAVMVLCSTQTEYNKKVKLFIALAPIVYLNNVRPFLSVIIQLSPFIDFILPKSFVEISGYYSLTKAIINLLCTQLVIGYELCYQGGINAVSGFHTNGIERGFFSTVVAHFPAGSSRKNLIHFAQMSQKKYFGQYDYGTTKNLMTYGSFTPPAYDISKVTTDIVLLSAKNDPVSTLEDVGIANGSLLNVVKFIEIERETYNHLDHMWAHDSSDIEYPYIMEIVAKYFSV